MSNSHDAISENQNSAHLSRPAARLAQYAFDLWGRNLDCGTLEVHAPGATSYRIGRGEPRAAIRLRSRSTLLRLLHHPSLMLGETYMDGEWEPEGNDLLQVLRVGIGFSSAWDRAQALRYGGIARGLLREFNTPRSSRRNASHHYDLEPALYARFLDADLHYSCAYFCEEDMTLEEAQRAKCEHIAAKLDLSPNVRVLDIGCGWGSLAMYLAQHHGAHVVGITLSEEQLLRARERASERGLQDQVEFRLEDYRKTTGQFDAVVSIGMFEHVGRPQYRSFFRKVCELLKPDGTALLHTIGRLGPPNSSNPWIDKYIFPGGYIPSAAEVISPLEASGIRLADFEVLRGTHYAQTLAEWHRRFRAARADFASRLSERFCRMWEFYLQGSEAAFRWGELAVFHAQMTRHSSRLPATRAYLYS